MTRTHSKHPEGRGAHAPKPLAAAPKDQALLALQRSAGNRAVAALVDGRPAAVVQRMHMGFNGTIPVPDQSDAEAVRSAGGQARWQHKLVGSNLTTVMLDALAKAGGARGMVDLLRQRESEKARTLEVVAAPLGGVTGNMATGGDLDWKQPWRVRIADDWRLQSAVSTVAHELKHNEQWYVRFGRGRVTKDGDSVPMDDVELASFEIPAKQTEAHVMASMAVKNVAERNQGATVYEKAGSDDARRAAAIEFLRGSAKNPVEAAALGNALIKFEPGTVEYDWHFFFPYLLRYALGRYTEDLKKARAAEALLAKDTDVAVAADRLAAKLGWARQQPEYTRVVTEVLRERSVVHPLVKQVALEHVAWFEAVRKSPGSRAAVDTGPTMQAIDQAVLRLVDLRDRAQDIQPY